MLGQDNPWIYPVVREKGWQKKGACRGQDPNIYVPEKKDKKDTKHYDKTICDSCVVKAECLDFALANRIKKGLWGGTVPKERDKMYRLYRGEREYELDLDWILLGKRRGNADSTVTDGSSESNVDLVCDPLAVNSPVYFTWVEELFVQGTLFAVTQYQVAKTAVRRHRKRVVVDDPIGVGSMALCLFYYE